ncbi:cupin domain-containing protein [Paenibacillus taiwanensis]|uniref:cupin domain-containing protein n=1 Tax=Paenibacillus taiwanensis TaxID=401638 RepID=UPI000407042D|nr:cupin domain-containing protein [Paenibacillus taiwanensis]
MYHHLGYHCHWHNPISSNWSHNYQSYCYPYHYRYGIDHRLYETLTITDYGPNPLVLNIDQAAKQNQTYRTALWTGKHFQVTLMSINVGEDIGLEVHPTTDQFIRIEEGQGLVQMGDRKDNLDFQTMAYKDYAIIIPAGKWHNLTNTGHTPLKIYVIYAPPQHPYGTVHETKAVAMSAEG